MQFLSATRRDFLSAALGAASSPLFATPKRHSGSSPPNLLLILADDLPAETVGCYGNSQAKTPNLDALARRGVRFPRSLATSRASSTGRATLLSGRTPMQHGVTGPGIMLGSNEVLLSDVLSGEGYDVGHVGAWGLSNDKQPAHGIRWSYILSGDQKYLTGDPVQEAGEPTAILAKRALEFLDQQKSGGKPFFLTIANPPAAGAPLIDSQLPSLIAKLRERAIEANTMIVFTSGGGSPESLTVPLIYCWPGETPVQSVRPELVGTYDFLPTICQAVEAATPDRDLPGRSYLPLVTGKPFPKKSPWRTMVYGTFGNAETATDNRFTLVVRDDGKGQNQLFDARSEAQKTMNQWTNRAYVTTRDDMRRQLTEWKARYTK